MKKKQMIKGLMFVGLFGIFNAHSPLVSVAEESEPIKVTDSSDLKRLDEAEVKDEMTLTTIEIISEKTTLSVNETLALTAKISSDSTIKTPIWTTSDESIATVSDSGIVTGKQAGSVSITATLSDKKTASVLLTVSEKKEAVTGTYGTVPWTWEAETQTIIFGEGNFPTSDWVNGIQPKIEKSTRLEGKKIKKIVFTKPVAANRSSDYLFYELSELEAIEGLNLLNTSNVSGMAYMFGAAFGPGNKLTTIDVSNWDTRNVTNMSYMFASASKLTTLDVSNWDTSKVTSMFAMFRDGNSLTSLNTSNWNTSSVTNMADMFRDANSLTTLDTRNWNTSNVTDMSYMFHYTKCLTTLDVSNWDISKVKNTLKMFNYASSLTSLDVSKWDTSSITNMTNMFYSATSLTALDVSMWNTSNVTNMDYLFGWMNNLTALDVSSWDTSNVTNMQGMFLHTESLTTLDVSKWNTSNVTNMDYLFRSANALTALDVSTWDISKVISMNFMFYNTKTLTALDVSKWDTSNVVYMNNLFNFALNLTSLDVSAWDTGKVKDFSHMFAYTKKLKTIDVSKWNTSSAIYMNNMFDIASNLTNVDVSMWDTSNVTNMSYMFKYASNLRTINISNWDTSKVTKMDQLFAYTNSLSTLVLGVNTVNIVKEASIPEKKDTIYTGKWRLVSPDIQNSYSSSADLMANYDGTKPGKYVREKYGDSTKVTGIELTPSTLELAISEEVALQARITPETASNKNIIYTTSDNSVATVSATGIVKGLKKGTAIITATTEDGNFQASSTVTILQQSSFLIDLFYLGIDDYVTGNVDNRLSAKKVQLVINGEEITTSTIFKDGSFELDTEGMITKVTDTVEVVALDRKNKELERETVAIEEKSYSLNVNPYTLHEDSFVTGQTDYFHTHVALVINGEEIERKLLSSNRSFSFDVEDLIDYADDEVEIIGYRYEEEITRKNVTVEEPKIDLSLTPYKVDDPYLTGKVTGKSATTVRLYVNRRRQQTVKIAEDGTFNLLGVAILSPTDKVEIAVLNDAGIEIQRFSVEISK
ncbi:BspA family leucine-rich repeat surface protein [Enterococcus rotai]|uniref:BspA family leucine-rich repeat surface protein n=1 Tax=Enterococcus rotai TaxID=118060 RepID=UPI0032B4863D